MYQLACGLWQIYVYFYSRKYEFCIAKCKLNFPYPYDGAIMTIIIENHFC